MAEERRRIPLKDASHDERMAIKRAIYKVVDSMIEGFAFRRSTRFFEPATRSQVAQRRFGWGQVVLEQALVEAFPRYAELARADIDQDVIAHSTDKVANREEEDTVFDPYRTIQYEVEEQGGTEQGMTVESVVLMEALTIYNEIVDRFHRGLADDPRELEDLRLAMRARYKDLVQVDTSDLRAAREQIDQRGGPVQRFLEWLTGA